MKLYNIETFPDKENIGIWYKVNNEVNKVAAIGIRVSKWIAYHGFAININNNLEKYKKIIPCGIKDKGITNLKNIINQDYSKLGDKLIEGEMPNETRFTFSPYLLLSMSKYCLELCLPWTEEP